MEKIQGVSCDFGASAEWSRFYNWDSVPVSVIFVLYKMESLQLRDHVLLGFSWQESHVSA